MKLLNVIRFNINREKSYNSMKKRSVKEIFLKKMEIQDLYLKNDREEKDNSILKAQLDVFNWILGEK